MRRHNSFKSMLMPHMLGLKVSSSLRLLSIDADGTPTASESGALGSGGLVRSPMPGKRISMVGVRALVTTSTPGPVIFALPMECCSIGELKGSHRILPGVGQMFAGVCNGRTTDRMRAQNNIVRRTPSAVDVSQLVKVREEPAPDFCIRHENPRGDQANIR